MFDKLEDLLIRFEEVLNELNEPTVANNQARFQKLMKEKAICSQLWMLIKNIKTANRQ